MMKKEDPADKYYEQQRLRAEQQAIQSLSIKQGSRDEFNTNLLKQFKDMDGTTEQKIKRLLNRLQKFFFREAKINIRNGYFCKKREPFYRLKNVKPINNQLILFGIDFAKFREIIKAYLPDDIEPLDMSHLKLVYESFDKAMEALRRNQRQEVIENETKLQPGLQQPPRGWMQMRPYYISNFQRRVLARFATTEQMNTKKSLRLQSNIPIYARKVYELKKKQSQQIMQKCRLREEKYMQRKIEKREKRHYHDDEDGENNFRTNRLHRKVDINEDQIKSQKSNTFRNGGGRNNREEKRERSRQKDFDDCRSAKSMRSSANSLANKLLNNMNLQQAEQQSVVSDLSFILQREQDKQLYEDMAIRLGLMNINTNNQSNHSFEIEQPNPTSNSFVSKGSFRLSENMPDQPDESVNYSFTKSSWTYSEYMEQKEKEEERKRQQERQIVIVIEDD